MQAEESAVTRTRRPILLVDAVVEGAEETARPGGREVGPPAPTAVTGWDRERLTALAREDGFVARTAASLHRACAQLARPEERVDALVLYGGAGDPAAAIESARAVRRVRPELAIVVATPDAGAARKLEGEIDATGLADVHCTSPATPEAILERLHALCAA